MSVQLSDADKMRAMRAAGMTIEAIAAVFDKARATVAYHVNPEYRKQQQAKNNARQRAKRRERGLKRAGFQATPVVTSDAPVYDGGPVWIEDRTINLYGVGSCEQREAVRRFRKCGSASLASWRKPENRPSPEPTVAPTHYVPAPIAAWDRYYKHGDGNAIAEYLRSIGR